MTTPNIDRMVEAFTPTEDTIGCETCGGRLEVFKRINPMGLNAEYPYVVLIDCIHDDEDCATLVKHRGPRLMGDTPTVWVRHRFNWPNYPTSYHFQKLADKVHGLLDGPAPNWRDGTVRFPISGNASDSPADWVTVGALRTLFADLCELRDVFEEIHGAAT